MFEVRLGNELSPNEVKCLSEQGPEIFATPHVGNKWRSDLFNTQMGVRMQIFEGNQSKLDMADYPEYLRIDRKKIKIATNADIARLSPTLELDHEVFEKDEDLRGVLEYGSTPAQIHHNSTMEVVGRENRELLPGISAELLFDEDVLDVLRFLLQEGEVLFDRQVSESGRISNVFREFLTPEQQIQSYIDLKKSHIDMILRGQVTESSGRLLSNAGVVFVSLLRNLVKQAKQGDLIKGTTRAKIYTVSGCDMVSYMTTKTMKQTFNRFYSLLRKLHPQIPESTELVIVPGAKMRFIPAEDETEIIDILTNLAEAFHMYKALSKSIGSATGDAKKNLIFESNQQKQKVKDIKDEFQLKYLSQPFFSQYDALKRNTKLAVIEGVNNMSFSDITRYITNEKK